MVGRMEADRDIYKGAEEQKRSDPLVDVDVVPRTERAANLRRALAFLLFGMVVIGIAAFLFAYFAERGEREDLEDFEMEPTPARAPRAAVTVPAPLLDESADWDLRRPTAPEDMDPARAGEAMQFLRQAQDHLREGDLAGGEEAALRALQIWPNMASALSMLGFITTQQGQFDRAIRYLNAAIEADPFAPDTYNTLAAVHMQRGEFRRAEELFHTSMQVQPGYARAFKNLGMLYIVIGEFELAIENFLLALEQNPGDAAVRNNLGVSYFRLNRQNEARAEFQRLIDELPQEPAWYFNMASTYAVDRRFDEAMNWIRQGSEFSAPVQFYRFMASAEFTELREQSEYRAFQQQYFPEVPVPVRPR